MYEYRFIPALLIASFAIVACEDLTDPSEDQPSDDESFAGSYALISINNNTVPVTIEDGWASGCDARIESASIELKTDRSFASAIAGEAIPGSGSCDGEAGAFSDSQSGTFHINGTTVLFDSELFEDTGVEPGTLSGSTLTVTFRGDGAETFLFEK